MNFSEMDLKSNGVVVMIDYINMKIYVIKIKGAYAPFYCIYCVLYLRTGNNYNRSSYAWRKFHTSAAANSGYC